MKSKLIKLSEEHYIIVDDSEIKESDTILWLEKKIWKNFQKSKHGYYLQMGSSQFRPIEEFEKITHSTKPLEIVAIRFRKPNPNRDVEGFDKIKELKLSEIEELVYGYNYHTLAKEACIKYGIETDFVNPYTLFIEGFKAHQELTKDKVFTLDQVNRLVNSVTEFMSHNEPSEFDDWYQKKLQKFLPKTEWDIKIDEQGKITLI